MKIFKELIIWQKGIEIKKKGYQLSKPFPGEEKFGLVAQITLALISIAANISEGSSRNRDKDYACFLQISLGSAFELKTYLIIAKELNLANTQHIIEIEFLLENQIKMIHGFLKKLTAIR